MVDEERELQARANIPAAAFEIPLEDFEVSDRVYAVISEAGYQTVGDLMMQMFLDPDAILRLSGMGPKAMRELETAIEKLNEQAAAQVAAETAVEPIEEISPAAEAVEAAEALEAPELIQPEPTPPEALETPGETLPETAAEVVTEEATQEELAPSEPEVVPAELAGAVEEIAPAEATEEEVESLDTLFSLPADALAIRTYDEEEEEDEDDRGQKKKGKKKKKKYVEVEYDPDQDVMLVKKKRKRGEEWEGNW